jgi:hypothetical protein
VNAHAEVQKIRRRLRRFNVGGVLVLRKNPARV